MDELNQALENLGRNITTAAKNTVTVKSGDLSDSINYSIQVQSDANFSVIIEELAYGEFINNRTGFMDRAIDSNLDTGVQEIEDAIITNILKDLLP